jgi:hypothetical protein
MGDLDGLLQHQCGVLTRQQALELGLTAKTIKWRVTSGRWQQLYPGVYATFSGEPDRNCLLWGAVLRAGAGAVLSHQTAAELWGLTDKASSLIHITVPSSRSVSGRDGIRFHYSLRAEEATHPAALPPRTRVEETVLDLAQLAATADDAMSWVFRACGGRLTNQGRLLDAVRLRRRLSWRAELVLALDPQNAGVHSALEHRYLTWVERPHGLPAGTRQLLVQRGRRRQYSDVDYEAYRTLVELDGRAAHSDSARIIDSQRDNANAADGKVTLRYNWAQVSQRSCEVAAEVASVLRARGWSGTLTRCGGQCRVRAVTAQPVARRRAGADGRCHTAQQEGRASAHEELPARPACTS